MVPKPGTGGGTVPGLSGGHPPWARHGLVGSKPAAAVALMRRVLFQDSRAGLLGVSQHWSHPQPRALVPQEDAWRQSWPTGPTGLAPGLFCPQHTS